MKLPLATAAALAGKITTTLVAEGYCQRAEAVGQIRLGLETVDRIRILVEGCDPIELRKRIAVNCQILSPGDIRIQAMLANNMPLDVYISHLGGRPTPWEIIPPNWGALLLSLTGNDEFNAHVARMAKAQYLHWDPVRGVIQPDTRLIEKGREFIMGTIRAATTEEEIFTLLQMPFIPPTDRNIATP